jgi:hypothetical protein
VETTSLPAITINERQHRVLVVVAAPLDGSVLAANQDFICFNSAANAGHRRKAGRSHSFTKAMAHEPSSLQ